MELGIKEIAQAITEGFKLLHTYKKDKHVRRLRAAVDNAEQYILEVESNDTPNDKLLRKYKRRFFKYNQG